MWKLVRARRRDWTAATVLVPLVLPGCGARSELTEGSRASGGAAGRSSTAPGSSGGRDTVGAGGRTGAGGIAMRPAAGGSSAGGTRDRGTGGRTETGGSPPLDSVEARTTACRHMFAVDNSARCGGPQRPQDELTREETLFVSDCVRRFEMPGRAVTVSALEACVAARAARPCDHYVRYLLPECDFRGTLEGGAPCFTGAQCRSGFCNHSNFDPNGFSSPPECSTCANVSEIGESCVDRLCTADAVCRGSCVKRITGGEGAACNEYAAFCAQGLFCDDDQLCHPLRGLYEPCSSTYGTGCVLPLVCGDKGRCKAPPTAGMPCAVDAPCATGLACDGATNTCEDVIWHGQGEPCDTGNNRCLRGDCVFTSVVDPHGTCPFVVSEGKSCGGASWVCDPGTVCFHGVCTAPSDVVCQ